jgi:hypothetical protein
LPAFIPPGFQIHEFSESDNSQDVPLDQQLTRQIMAAYGVPMFAVGIDTNVNRATGETTMWAWDQNGIEPMTDLIADAFSTQMMAIDFGPEFVVKFENFVAPDKEFELEKRRQELDQGVVTINEVRRAQNMDEVAWGDLPKGSLADQPYTGEVMDEADPETSEDPNALRGSGARDETRADPWSPESTWQRNLSIERRRVPRWQRQQLKFWAAQRDATLKSLAKHAGVTVNTVMGRTMGSVTPLERGISVDEIFIAAGREWRALYQELLAPEMARVYAESGAFAHSSVAGFGEFWLTPRMKAELESLGAQYVVNVDSTTKRKIGEVLAEATGSGESVEQMARKITAVFRDKLRAKTIARTEIGMANQSGTQAGFSQSGVVERKTWNTSRDGRVRDSHRIDGQEVALDEDFVLLDGDRGPYPLARTLDVSNIANCRCFMTPVISGLVDQSEPDQDNEG